MKLFARKTNFKQPQEQPVEVATNTEKIEVSDYKAVLWVVTEGPESGQYVLVSDAIQNGMPVWVKTEYVQRAAQEPPKKGSPKQLSQPAMQATSWYLFCGLTGRWLIADARAEKANFQMDDAPISSIDPADDRMPDAMGIDPWQIGDVGGQAKRLDRRIKVLPYCFFIY
eukprot:TRINITY_DN22658_c0_g1_i1.p1 TRINITY_DN22658_c0_g1~~TRINITY_DN22658_c0_g1_i1.p1  ORF type:complete len:169 (-),score=26.79 TRINITY_DN22658_c0_g1_i1:136-642(-)